jgi:uncharacterized protein (TIGR03437 family)
LPAPSITSGGIVPVDSTVATIQPGEWVSIYGTNLASSTVTWNGNFPTSLGGTSVTINGKAAYLSFVSPGQINLQAPNDTATGAVPVVVTTAGGSATSTVTLAQFGPSFFLLDTKHVAGIIVRSDGSGANGGGTYDIIGPTGTSLGYPTVAAKAGDIVELYGTGLGPTNPVVPAGQVFSGAAPTSNPVKLLIDNVSVTPMFAGLSGAGLYQINLTVPAGLGTGDVSLVATVGGAQTPSGVVISLQPAGSVGVCVDISGNWISVATGTVTQTLTIPGDPGDSGTTTAGIGEDSRGFPVEGTATFLQNGCSFQFTPAAVSGLLTPQQAAALQRTGTVTGTSVTVQGPLTLPQLTTPGFTITQVVENQIQGSGHLSGSVLVLTEAGSFQGSGTFSVNGQSGTFTVTYAVSATETLTPALTVTSGLITTVAGDGTQGFSGDGGPATSASLNLPGGESDHAGIAVDVSGNLFIADWGNNRIRKVSASGIITTVAGNGNGGTLGGFSGDGGPATSASLAVPSGVAVDASGDLLIADQYNHRIRKVSATSGIITTVAGNGIVGFSGDGGPATSASLGYPLGVAVDAAGNLFIADGYRIRKVSASGVITTVAGNGTQYLGGFSDYCYCQNGDGGPATSASIGPPSSIAVDASGNFFFNDIGNLLIRRVSASGIITTVAGNGTPGFSGDGGPANLAELTGANGIAVDAFGNLFIADSPRVREVPASPSGIITIAGNGNASFSGDGGPATSAGMCAGGVAVDASGNLFIADACNSRIREVSPSTVELGALSTAGTVPFPTAR